jgi:LysM repeat protein
MKYGFGIVLVALALGLAAVPRPGHAQSEEPTVYVIQKGDTLWGLSERFMKDSRYWPNLWARNPENITNPHFIFPGQKLKFYSDRVVIENARGEEIPLEELATRPVDQPAPSAKAAGEPVPAPERAFTVSGGEGFILEGDFKPAGFIISTYQNRRMVGEDDIVYVDLGRANGAKVGDRFSVYKKLNAISHPVNSSILGNRVIPLGTVQLAEVEEKVAKALVTKTYLEIEPGCFLLPYQARRREVALKAADRDLTGYIVETKTGSKAIAAGDVAFLDLGKRQGVVPGNLLYVVRDVQPDSQFVSSSDLKLPVDVVGALVVVETGDNTATALVVKSIDTIYRGDRVELKKNR